MKIFGEGDQLTIQLEGLEKLWALKSRIKIPRQVISNINLLEESPKKNFALPFIKFPGTVLPGVLLAGSFIKPGERDFWYLRVHHPGVLSIDLDPGSFAYDRIMVSCDSDSAAQAINWWRGL